MRSVSERDRTGPRADRPKANADPAELARKGALLGEAHIRPLTEFVERLRAEWGASVPWFDPTEGGVSARILLLLEAPGRKAALIAEGGSSFVSPDNDDETAKNMWLLLKEARVDRREVVTWNVVPWYVERTSLGASDLAAARPALHELLELLPHLRVVVLLGRRAARAWEREAVGVHILTIKAPHPSPLALNRSPERREQLREALASARELAGHTS